MITSLDDLIKQGSVIQKDSVDITYLFREIAVTTRDAAVFQMFAKNDGVLIEYFRSISRQLQNG